MEPIDLSALEAELAADGPLLESSSDAMHLWLAAGQLLFSLNNEVLTEHIKSLDPVLMDPIAVRDMLRDARLEGDEAVDRLLDTLGDFAKVILGELADFAVRHEFGDAAFLVYFPCHNGNGTLTLRDKDTGTYKLREW